MYEHLEKNVIRNILFSSTQINFPKVLKCFQMPNIT